MNKHSIHIVLFAVLCSSLWAVTVQFDANGYAVVGGTKKFVYGAYRDPGGVLNAFGNVVDAQFNLTHDDYFETALQPGYAAGDVTALVAAGQSYLTAANTAGVGVFMSLPRESVWNQDNAALTQYINGLKGYNALWFWLLMEEPTATPNAASAMQNAYNLIKSLDTNHPVVIIDSLWGLVSQSSVANYCDGIWAKNHKVPYSQIAIGREVSAIKAAYPTKTVWAVCQAGDRLNTENRAGKFPAKIIPNENTATVDAKAIRAQAHAAIAGGAKGVVFHWGSPAQHDLLGDTPFVWKALDELGAELASLSGVLMSTDAVPAFTITDLGYGKANRIKGYYGQGESGPLPPIGAPANNHTVWWTRMSRGHLYIGFAADYMCQNRIQIDLPFAFSQVRQYPGAQIVMQKSGSTLTISYPLIPAAIWNVQTFNYFDVMINERDCLVWQVLP